MLCSCVTIPIGLSIHKAIFPPREQPSSWSAFLLPLLLTLLVTGVIGCSIQGNAVSERKEREAREARIKSDDGYYDFGDGRLYFNSYDDWYYTDADGGSELWIKMRGRPRLPDGSLADSANEGPYFLQKDWDPDWPGSPCTYSNRRDKEKEGYYDFGDGRVYYQRDGRWFSSGKDDDPWSVWNNSDDYGIELGDGSSVSATDYDQYYLSGSWDESWGVDSVEDSAVWDSYYGHHSSDSGSSGSSSDSFSSDYDSWDSDDTDWDSDW